MEGRNIPGFYYDKEKKKYFKIIPRSKLASRSESAVDVRYSVDNVKQEKKVQKAQQVRVARQSKTMKECVKRSEILRSATAVGIGIMREIAQNVNHNYQAQASQAYGAGFDKSWICHAATGNINGFALETITNTYLVGSTVWNGIGQTTAACWRQLGFAHISNNHCQSRDNNVIPYSNYQPIHRLGENMVTSVCFSPSHMVAIATTLGGPNPCYSILSQFDIPEHGSPFPRIKREIMFRGEANCDVWDSAANPFLCDVTTFATASTKRVKIFYDAGTHWGEQTILDTMTAAMAVDWLSPTVLASGLRSGLVYLSDTRNRDSAMRLQVPSCITGIKRVTAETLVICGTEDTLALYDLRMPRVANISATLSPESCAQGGKRRRWIRESTTTPALQYEFESPGERRGFAVSSESGLVAAVDADNLVQLFTLHSATSVSTLRTEHGPLKGKPGRPRIRGPVTALQFTTTKEGRDQLTAACDQELFGFQWCDWLA